MVAGNWRSWKSLKSFLRMIIWRIMNNVFMTIVVIPVLTFHMREVT